MMLAYPNPSAADSQIPTPNLRTRWADTLTLRVMLFQLSSMITLATQRNSNNTPIQSKHLPESLGVQTARAILAGEGNNVLKPFRTDPESALC